MAFLAIDPGSEKSASVLFKLSPFAILDFGISDNAVTIELCRDNAVQKLIIEEIKSYGNIIGDSILKTVKWCGRFEQAAMPIPTVYIPRKTIVTGICGHARAKDKNVRQALIDHFSDDGTIEAIGTKKMPGPLYGVSKDVWSALAIAVYYSDTQCQISMNI